MKHNIHVAPITVNHPDDNPNREEYEIVIMDGKKVIRRVVISFPEDEGKVE